MEKQAFLVHLYKNKNAADTTFVVEGKQFHAHKLMILDHAKKLFELSKDCTKEETILITSMKKSVIQKILKYIYTVEVPKFDTASEVSIFHI